MRHSAAEHFSWPFSEPGKSSFFIHSVFTRNRSTDQQLSFQRDYGTGTAGDHVYRLPKYVSSGGRHGGGVGGSSNFSLAECKDEEDASRKKEVDDLISKYAPKNADKQLEQVSLRRTSFNEMMGLSLNVRKFCIISLM